MINKVALVTGSSQGIGFAIAKEFMKRTVKTVYVTAMTEQLGSDAIGKLKVEGFKPEFHLLDVTDATSVKNCADYVLQKHGRLDILVNNAGVTVKDLEKTTYEDSVRVLNTNYYGNLTVEKHFFPILNQNARVINISSICGHISNLRNKYWIGKLTNNNLERADIDAFVNWFLDSVKNGKVKAEDFFQTEMLAYRISKIALCALTILQQREIGRNISVNSIHPGFVKTSINRGMGFYSEEQGAKAPVYLALDVDQSVKGQYFWPNKKTVLEAMDWSNPDLPLYFDYELFRKIDLNNK
ncbi:carbonyl reductase [NADPH] 1-like [Cydia amplana]|uniref:carbonyl reductase [NADPH] 1-like n=1 Tax=Cydia amplana TaxID=1869771 RepID=UPI002FE5ADB5